MRKSSPLFRRFNCLTADKCCLNRFTLRISRSLDEACQALPGRKGCCESSCGIHHGKYHGRHHTK